MHLNGGVKHAHSPHPGKEAKQGPGEYLLTKGRMDVRGGKYHGGDTALAPVYGFECSGARHDQASFSKDSEFYMTFLGPLTFIQPDGSPIAVVGWEQAQDAWLA